MTTITINNLNQLCLGAALLGSGGGGDTNILSGFVQDQLNAYGPVHLMQTSELCESDLIIPIAYIGSPAVSMARGVNIPMFKTIVDAVQNKYKDKNVILMPAEIGGCNALTPFVLSGAMQLPVLDADLIGRAFPKISMCKPSVTLIKQTIDVYVGSDAGECYEFCAESAELIEREARQYVSLCGGSASIAVFICDGLNYQDYVIKGSLSNALILGELVERYRLDRSAFYEIANAESFGVGVISEINRVSENGFLRGSVVISTSTRVYTVKFLNEYFSIEDGSVLYASTPDLIVLLDAKSGLPLSSESLSSGVSVDIVKLNAPEFWKTPEALSKVTLSQFTGGET